MNVYESGFPTLFSCVVEKVSDFMSLVGSTNEEKIWNFLKSKGLNDYGVAGLMGNLYAESGLIPNNLQNSYESALGFTDSSYVKAVDSGTYSNFVNDYAGFGLAQWTYCTRKKALLNYAESKGASIGDLEMQLEYLYKELSSDYKAVLNTLKTTASVLEASNAVLLKFERPADQSTSMQNRRASYGQKYYDKYTTNNTTDSDNGDNGNNGDDDMSYTKGKAVKLSTNFKSTEFDCHGSGCCSSTKVDDKLVEYLQKIRDHFGKSVTITSGYRCTKHNKNVGGVTGSYHTYGQAADIVISGVTPREVAKYAESIGVKGIGLYETSSDGYFTHIDTRSSKSFWYGQAGASRSTFGGSTSSSSSVLKNGSTGDKVKDLQNKLIALGYSCGNYGADGSFGTSTETAVRKFQSDNGLTVDGIVGANTLKALESASAATKIKVTASVLNVRAGAGTNYKVVTTIKKGSTYNLLEEKDGWGKISLGWISSTYYEKV